MERYCPIEDCDVDDLVKLKAFRDQRLIWEQWIIGDEFFSIQHQISDILWDYAIIKLILESCKHTDDVSGYIASDSNFIDFIIRNSAQMVALKIRRIIEKPDKIEIKKQISLKVLLNSIKSNKELITRQNFVCFNGLPYNYEPVRERYNKDLFQRIRCNGGPIVESLPSKGPEAWAPSERAHHHFDVLAGADRERDRTDLINEAHFWRVEQILNSNCFQKCRDFASKFVAHASDQKSRESYMSLFRGFLQFSEIDTCIDRIRDASNLLCGDFIFVCHTGDSMPWPQFDPVEPLMQRWAPDSVEEKIRHSWQEIFDKFRNYSPESVRNDFEETHNG